MARYREKDETDLVWNRIRRHLTRELDTRIQDRREEALNQILSKAWEDYARSLQTGDVKELEARYEQYTNAIVKDIVPDAASILPDA